MLHSLDLVDSVPPWYSPSEPKPVNHNDQEQAVWDVPVYADHVLRTVRANRVDARIVDSTATSVTLLEMSCPWLNNKETKSCEKTEKYAPLRLELKRQFPGYQVKQFNIIMDVLGGYSKELESTIRSLVGVSITGRRNIAENAEIRSVSKSEHSAILQSVDMNSYAPLTPFRDHKKTILD